MKPAADTPDPRFMGLRRFFGIKDTVRERTPRANERFAPGAFRCDLGPVRDISMRGVCVSPPPGLPLAINQALTIEVAYGDMKIRAVGVVRWIRGKTSGPDRQVGIMLTNLSSYQEHMLAHLAEHGCLPGKKTDEPAPGAAASGQSATDKNTATTGQTNTASNASTANSNRGASVTAAVEVHDLYEILGVTPAASEEDLRTAYRALVRRFHPDANPSPDAAQRMTLINKAYSVLKHADMRQRYDQIRARAA